MPLQSGTSDETVKKNIEKEMSGGASQPQAVAIALSKKEESNPAKRRKSLLNKKAAGDFVKGFTE